MRKSILFIVGLLAIALIPHDAAAVKLAQQQVKDVCGKKLRTGGDAMGCTKQCGLNNEHTCDFGCKGNDCNGSCMTCGVKARIIPHPYANRVVRAELAMPMRASYRARRPSYCEWCYASCPPGWGGWLCRLHCQSRGGCQPPVVRHP
jgi:hypothetical protein